MSAALPGGCACGELRYQVRGEPIFVNNCHCTLCQRQTGSTSVVNAFFEADSIEVTRGTLREHVVEAGSGGPHTICRCTECGTAILSYYPRLGRLGAGLRVGTLDDPAAFRPDAVIFTASAMPWVAVPQDIPAFERTYNPADILPPERLARLMDMVERSKLGG